MSAFHAESKKIKGIGVSSGICRGRAVVLGAEQDSADDPLSSDPVVLVGLEFSPEEVLSMDSEHVCGFVTVSGGRTAPAGIIARSSDLTAVLACPDCTVIETGDLLIVDGTSGEVVINPSPEMAGESKFKQAQIEKLVNKSSEYRHLPAETKDGFSVDILASIDLVDAIPQAITGGASGIGLLRSEFYYLTGDGAPSEEFLFTLYQHALSSVAPLPVTIRTLDLSGGAQVLGFEQYAGHNPALGLKGVRFSLQYQALFKTQLRALYRASAFGKLRILLPMVGSCDELGEAQTLLIAVQDELRAEDVDMADSVDVGIMIEVPSAVFMASSLAKNVDFFAIGINDLIQYGLAIDRGTHVVSHLYEPLDPAILQMIGQVVQAGHHAGIDVGMCGEMAGESQYTPLLLGLDLDWLSVPVSAIGSIKKRVRASLASDCADLGQHLLGQSSAQELKRDLLDYLHSHYSDNPEVLG